MTLIYLVALVALGLHLAHGVFSAQQTLGWTGSAAGYRRAKVVGHTLGRPSSRSGSSCRRSRSSSA